MDSHTAGTSSGGSGNGVAQPRRTSRMPKYSKFTQQELPACKPILTPKWVISVFVLGVIFVPVGVVSLRASQQVVEIVDRYDSVTDKRAYIRNDNQPRERALKQIAFFYKIV